jgi:hypothetical protein
MLGAIALLAVVGCEDDDDPLAIIPARNFAVVMTGAKERPNPVNPAGNGTATFTLDDAGTTISYTISVAGMTSNITASHIHQGNANAAFAGNIIVTLATPVNGQTVTGTITQASTLGLGLTFASLVELMRTGDVYVNVHTANNTGGEIRGQIEAQP